MRMEDSRTIFSVLILPLALLFVLQLSGEPIPTEAWKHHQLTAEMPLSDGKYENFFQVINNPCKIGPLCLFRAVFGCQKHVFHKFDLYENHGIIPKGKNNSPNLPKLVYYNGWYL
uniref:Uncharacterized protein n=1 Tax=Anolis carolinensis TaxID=28377 RepID=G1K870_ANOCA